MFTTSHEVGDEQAHEHPTEAARPGVRNLGLSTTPAGTWALPGIPAGVLLGDVRNATNTALAKLALEATRWGFQLPPADEFNGDLEILVADMLKRYLKRKWPNTCEPLPLSIAVLMSPSQIQLRIEAATDCAMVLLKKPVTELNQHIPGLGWWISDVISDGHSVGLTTYDLRRISSIAEYHWFYGASTDREMYDEVRQDVDAPDSGELTDEEVREYLLENFQATPSTFSQMYGGHGELISWRPKSKAWLRNSIRQAKTDTDIPTHVRRLVCLTEQAAKSMQRMRKHEALRHQDDFNYEEPIGATAFVLWDESEALLDLISEYEQMAQQGDCTISMEQYDFDLSDEAALPRFFTTLRDYLQAYADFSALLRALEAEKETP